MKNIIVILLLILTIVAVGCNHADSISEPTATSIPAQDRVQPPTATPVKTPSPTPTPDHSVLGELPSTIEEVLGREIYVIDSKKSLAVFQVGEVLTFNPNPIIVEVATELGDEAITGQTSFYDPEQTTIKLDIHKLKSDQSNRDRFIRQRLFLAPDGQFATLSLINPGPLPNGVISGDKSGGSSSVNVAIEINGVSNEVPFDIDFKYDEEENSMALLGNATITWADLGITKEDILAARPVVSVEDEIKVQILLVFVPSTQ